MQSNNSQKKISYQLCMVLIAILLTSTTYWMTWPFLVIVLHQQYFLSISKIGALLSFSILISTLIGMYVGNLADRIGKCKIILVKQNTPSFSITMRILVKDRAFMLLVLANIFLWIIFMQFEVSIAQYFSTLKIDGLVKLLGILFFVNTLTILSLQIPVARLMKNLEILSRLYIGIIILCFSQILFAFAGIHNHDEWIFSTFIFEDNKLKALTV